MNKYILAIIAVVLMGCSDAKVSDWPYIDGNSGDANTPRDLYRFTQDGKVTRNKKDFGSYTISGRKIIIKPLKEFGLTEMSGEIKGKGLILLKIGNETHTLSLSKG